VATLLDCIRHGFGDEAADALEIFVSAFEIRVICGLPPELQNLPDINFAELVTPSPGYEPMLIEMGLAQCAARAISKVVVKRANKLAEESKLYPEVLRRIRSLASGPRQRAAFVRHARVLSEASEIMPILVELALQASVSDWDFIRLLKLAATGDDTAFNPLTEMAGKIASRLPGKRGPKISAPSAAHEFLLHSRLIVRPFPKAPQNRRAEYVDALTFATRREFNNPDFDSRSARRRWGKTKG
jgi:hypothetical protein